MTPKFINIMVTLNIVKMYMLDIDVGKESYNNVQMRPCDFAQRFYANESNIIKSGLIIDKTPVIWGVVLSV